MADNLITVTIESTAAEEPLTIEVNVNQPVHALKGKAMAQLGIDPSQADKYRLILEGSPLSEDQTVAEAGITDGATLVLTPIAAEVI